MKKFFKGFKLKFFIITMVIGLAYPIIKASISTNKLLVFSDTCFLIGMLITLPGIFYGLNLHGDYDLGEYIAARSFMKKRVQKINEFQSYDKFVESKNKQREERFNYPLLVGIIIVIISIITSKLV